jgi:4'-phosphopantetheinyl transferase
MIDLYGINFEKKLIIKEYPFCFRRHTFKENRYPADYSPSMKILPSVIGEFLVRHIVSIKFNCDPQDITISLDSSGKPYFNSFKSCHFNISHSGNWVVCAFENDPVGIDIQKIIKIPRKELDAIVLRFFHKDEQIQYFNLEDSEKENFFFTQWAIKESYIKLVGTPSQISLQSFSAFLDQDGRGSISNGSQIRYFQQYDIDSNYKLVACCSNDSFPSSLKKIIIPPNNK